ncbi:GTA-gp10 family protein [Blastomonas sp. CCH1-A6]|uniref:GTA-gp10 family protein n=1 Tax=Blastomonas sp. CCH1-A6 TaxID=1768762 RepID=UPI00082D9382|tara:strand:+ start:21417 stop:21902 length:486 start_codon:yes stop_codon:yes gene_type:complete
METALSLEFADGTYAFDLKLPQIIELQEKCGTTGPDGARQRKNILAIYSSVMAGRALIGDGVHIGVPDQAEAAVQEVYETIRLALIGGGEGIVDGETVRVSPLDAKRLVETYVHPMPLVAAWDIAAAILYARIVGYQAKKKAVTPEADGASETQADSATPA